MAAEEHDASVYVVLAEVEGLSGADYTTLSDRLRVNHRSRALAERLLTNPSVSPGGLAEARAYRVLRSRSGIGRPPAPWAEIMTLRPHLGATILADVLRGALPTSCLVDLATTAGLDVVVGQAVINHLATHDPRLLAYVLPRWAAKGTPRWARRELDRVRGRAGWRWMRVHHLPEVRPMIDAALRTVASAEATTAEFSSAFSVVVDLCVVELIDALASNPTVASSTLSRLGCESRNDPWTCRAGDAAMTHGTSPRRADLSPGWVAWCMHGAAGPWLGWNLSGVSWSPALDDLMAGVLLVGGGSSRGCAYRRA
mgnify:CR=1 FL=1